MPPQTPSSITPSTFRTLLSRYPSTVPETLQSLDTLRYTTIPDALAARSAKDAEDAHLTKDEVLRLVEWKLKHGTFRPTLLTLVSSNPSSTIISTTSRAFSTFLKPSSFSSPSDPDPLPAIKILSELKGIGPATASLLLSVFDPENVVFFSDEVFRWLMWGEAGSGKGGGGMGWKRVIKYNVKEYVEVVGRGREVRRRLGVKGVEVEKVAWVLGREGVDVDEDVDDEGEKEVDGEVEKGGEEVGEAQNGEDEEEVVTKKKTKKDNKDATVQRVKKGVKRKTEDPKDVVPEGVRRSSRGKVGT